jgi:hypothetical protein
MNRFMFVGKDSFYEEWPKKDNENGGKSEKSKGAIRNFQN